MINRLTHWQKTAISKAKGIGNVTFLIEDSCLLMRCGADNPQKETQPLQSSSSTMILSHSVDNDRNKLYTLKVQAEHYLSLLQRGLRE